MKRLACLAAAAVLTASSLFAAGGGAPLPSELRVSYAKSPFNLPLIVAVKRGMLDEAFAAKGVAVKLFEIDSGAKQAEAMAAAGEAPYQAPDVGRYFRLGPLGTALLPAERPALQNGCALNLLATEFWPARAPSRVSRRRRQQR